MANALQVEAEKKCNYLPEYISVDEGHHGDELLVADLPVPVHVGHLDHLRRLLLRELLPLKSLY